MIAVALSGSGFAAGVTFAEGKVYVPLPERFTVSQKGERLIATYGEGGSYRLEMTLARVLDDANSTNPAYDFVFQLASLQDGTVVQSDRIIFMAADRQIESEGIRVMHWQIGVHRCVLEMTVTGPVPTSQDLYNALGSNLNTILNGVKCAVP
jgi:hypothetical protein